MTPISSEISNRISQNDGDSHGGVDDDAADGVAPGARRLHGRVEVDRTQVAGEAYEPVTVSVPLVLVRGDQNAGPALKVVVAPVATAFAAPQASLVRDTRRQFENGMCCRGAALPHQEISTALAQVYKTIYGRGPTKLSTMIGRDVVVCVMEDANTPGQSMLVDFGHAALAEETRLRLQTGMAPQMVEVVERITGRKVRCHVPGVNAMGNAATDTFLLEPTDG